MLVGILGWGRWRRNDGPFATPFTTTSSHGNPESNCADDESQLAHSCVLHNGLPAPFFSFFSPDSCKLSGAVPLTEKKTLFPRPGTAAPAKASRFSEQRGHDSDFPRLHKVTRSGEGQRPTDRSLFMPLALSLSLPLLFTRPLAGDL
jgi:hypothetical protein